MIRCRAVRRSLAFVVGALLLGCAATSAAGAAAPVRPGIWLSPAEVQRLPERGPAWAQLVQVADEPMGHADIADQNSDHDIHVLGAALVYARTGEARFYRKAAAGVMDAIGTERGGRTLALARGLVSYVVAADLLGLRDREPARARVFRRWLAAVRHERLEPDSRPTLVATHERAPNNWGTHAGASRIAADIYLGDQKDLARAAAVFKGWLGDRAAYHGFSYGEDLSWQAYPKSPVGVDPPGAVKHGHSIDGALPDDMRRGCSLRFPPCATLYPWEAMQGAVVQAELLSRQGYNAWSWGHQALRRAATFLFDLSSRYRDEDWGAPAGDEWIPWLLNARYGTRFPTVLPARPGKGMGYTDWSTDAPEGCPRPSCAAASAPHRTVIAVPSQNATRGERRGEDGETLVLMLVATVAALGALLLARRRSRLRRTH
jgi:hypothetical protein